MDEEKKDEVKLGTKDRDSFKVNMIIEENDVSISNTSSAKIKKEPD